MQFTGILNSMGHMTFRDWIAPSIDIPEGDQRFIDEFIKRNAKGTFVLLEGGADIDPSIYGQENLYSNVGLYSKERDVHERRVIDAALKNEVPIFGICRGHQLLAAHLGGALYQDIGIQTGVRHNATHNVETFDLLRDFSGRMQVNSYHHQAVSKLPTNAVELAAYILNRKDGTTLSVNEAIFYPRSEYTIPMFSVQWHPEFMSDVDLVDWVVTQLFGFTPIERNENLYSAL